MQTVKGLFLKTQLASVKKRLGDKALAEVERLYGPTQFSAFKDYPRSEEFRFLKIVGKILYGNDEHEAFRKVGADAFQIFAQNPIGKTVFTLLGNDLKKVSMNIQKAFDTVSTGVEMKTEDLGDSHIRISIWNDTFPADYYMGLFEEATKYFGEDAHIELRITPNLYVYDVSW